MRHVSAMRSVVKPRPKLNLIGSDMRKIPVLKRNCKWMHCKSVWIYKVYLIRETPRYTIYILQISSRLHCILARTPMGEISENTSLSRVSSVSPRICFTVFVWRLCPVPALLEICPFDWRSPEFDRQVEGRKKSIKKSNQINKYYVTFPLVV